VALKKIPQKPRNDKPLRIPLPHPIYAVEGAELCLFVKDHAGEQNRAERAAACAAQGRSGSCSGGVPGPSRWTWVDPRRALTAAGEGHKAAKLKVKEEQVAGVAKVVGISKLR
jgi:ribosome biogenesis protein UTP30